MGRHRYAWCLVNESQPLLTVKFEGSKSEHHFALDKLRTFERIEVGDRGQKTPVRVEVVADGPTKVIRFMDHVRAPGKKKVRS